jgi:hypothetical protein
VNRRQFIGHLTKVAAIAVLLPATFEMEGCNVLSEIQAWVPTGEKAVNAILAVLVANNIPVSAGVQAAVGLVETGFNDLLAAIQEYESTTPPPVGALAKIQTIMKDISDQFSNFVAQLSGTGSNVLKVVVALATVVISTIGGFISQLGPTPAPSVELKLSGVVIPAVQRSNRKFKSDWNSQLNSAKALGVNCPKYAYL